MQKILISRCLLGHKVRYDGGASGPFDQLAAWQAEGRVVAICPEVAGGLPTPRPAAEIGGGQGADVWDGRASVLTAEGEDFSAAFLDGAWQALALVQRHNIRIAVLKANSPSCGNLLTYDGTFRGVKVPGDGVTASRRRCSSAMACRCSVSWSCRRRHRRWRNCRGLVFEPLLPQCL